MPLCGKGVRHPLPLLIAFSGTRLAGEIVGHSGEKRHLRTVANALAIVAGACPPVDKGLAGQRDHGREVHKSGGSEFVGDQGRGEAVEGVTDHDDVPPGAGEVVTALVTAPTTAPT